MYRLLVSKRNVYLLHGLDVGAVVGEVLGLEAQTFLFTPFNLHTLVWYKVQKWGLRKVQNWAPRLMGQQY